MPGRFLKIDGGAFGFDHGHCAAVAIAQYIIGEGAIW